MVAGALAQQGTTPWSPSASSSGRRRTSSTRLQRRDRWAHPRGADRTVASVGWRPHCDTDQRALDRAGLRARARTRAARRPPPPCSPPGPLRELAGRTPSPLLVDREDVRRLWTELGDKARSRPEGSGTVRQLDAGVHAIGKKLVRGGRRVLDGRGARGATGPPRRSASCSATPRSRCWATGLGARRRLRTPLKHLMALLRIAVPNKAALALGRRDPPRVRYRQREDSKQLTLTDHRERRRVLLPATPRHRPVRRRGHADVGITGRDLLKDPGRAKAER